jgi:twitching motility protein PilT
MIMDYSNWIKRLLKIAIEQKATDLHLVADYFPTLRIERELVPLNKEKRLTEEDTKELVFAILSPKQREKLLKELEIDFSFEFENYRFRGNAFFQKGKISLALRILPKEIKTIEELNLPSQLHFFTQAQQGLVLICGPSSHGKSTTLAALIEEINQTRNCHIITIEDPIEYVFEGKKAMIEQREVGSDTETFHEALRHVLRQDPDVIMVGEMRDPESISMAITAAETGHLVFSTLHTNSAAQTIHRIIDSFPPNQQPQIKSQLSACLLGIVSQRLVKRIKGGLIPACEILINTPAIANLIREGKIHEIPIVIENSREIGMISLNRYLAELVKKGEIDIETARAFSLSPSELKFLIK